MFVYAVYLTALVVCGLTYWKGDPALRLTAMVLIVSWASTPLVMYLDRRGLNMPVSIVDIVTALIYVWISMRWRRIWCAVMAALAIIVFLIPFVALSDRTIHRYNQLASNNIVAGFQLVLLLVATWLAVRARRRADEGTVRP